MDTQARIEAAKARLEANRAVLVLAKKAGPPCTKCAYYLHVHSGDPARKGYQHKPSMCTHPVFQKATYSTVAGHITKAGHAPVFQARGEDGLCGAEAILFQRRPLFLLTLLRDRWILAFLIFVAFWIGILTIHF